MKRIYFKFISTTTITGLIVRLFTWSKWSHVDILLDDSTLMGAIGPKNKVVIHDGSQDSKFRSEYKYALVNDEKYHLIMDWYKLQENKKYDWLAVFSFLFNRNWQDEDKWFCSELALAGLHKFGIDILNEKANRVTPKDLFKSKQLL